MVVFNIKFQISFRCLPAIQKIRYTKLVNGPFHESSSTSPSLWIMESTLLHPLPPLLHLHSTSGFLNNLWGICKSLGRFLKAGQAYPVMKNQIHMGGGMAWLSALWNRLLVLLIFFQTNDRAERQVCMSVFRNVYYLIIDSGNESRCDFSCFHYRERGSLLR